MEQEPFNAVQQQAVITALEVLSTVFDTVIVAVADDTRAKIATGGSNDRTLLLSRIITNEVEVQIKQDPHGTRIYQRDQEGNWRKARI